jgi:hypothetical protein
MDLILERIELRPRRREAIDRRLIARERAADGVPVQPGPPMDLADRQPPHEAQPPHLHPLLHSDHLGPPGSLCADESRLRRPPDGAQVVQSSIGAGGPVSPGADISWIDRATVLDANHVKVVALDIRSGARVFSQPVALTSACDTRRC